MEFLEWLTSWSLTPESAFHILVMMIFGIFWIGVFLILYHLARFGIGTQPKKYALLFFIGAIIIFSVTTELYRDVDVRILLSIYE